MIEYRVSTDLPRFDLKTSQGFPLSLKIDHDIAFRPTQKGDPLLSKLDQQSHPGIAPIQDQQRPALDGETTHGRQNQTMFQNVLAFMNPPFHKTGEGNRKHSPFID